jgi:hypothetical protein
VKSKLTKKAQAALDATSRPSPAAPRKGSGSRGRSRRSG